LARKHQGYIDLDYFAKVQKKLKVHRFNGPRKGKKKTTFITTSSEAQ